VLYYSLYVFKDKVDAILGFEGEHKNWHMSVVRREAECEACKYQG